MAELLKPTDTLAQGYPKINAAIEQAEQAFTTADNAMDTANSSIAVSNQALANSQSTQEQLNQVVIEGDSSIEAAQARVNADNTITYDTLKERLDAEHQEVSSQLAQNTQKLNGLSIYANKNVSRIVGHRGLNTLAPENTLPSYELAGQCGVKYFECDASVTSDGVVVLMHDETIDRMTNGTGNILDITYATLQSYVVDAGSNILKYPNLKIPTLAEYLNVCRKYNAVPVIDIKSTRVSDIINVIRNSGFETNCHVICSASNLEETRQLSPVISIWYWVKSLTDAEITNGGTNKVSVMASTKTQANSDIVQKCHFNGMGVVLDVIYNYNDVLTYTAMGVDFLTCESTAIGGAINV